MIGREVGVLVIDIDRFKTINERYGHEGGDLVLQMLVKFMSSSLRRCDKVFRYGGDEFAIILANPDCAEVEAVAQRIAGVIASTPIVYSQGKVLCTVSIGKAKGYIVENGDLDSLIRVADNELMTIKNLRNPK
ncbi:Diguanylate cyclase DosC [bioreactor metagenome]|uniref:Diguanylate cyclase DosC n=1 Tax=bioreactor metagenome TaxID=1076179 RepID=A0A645INF9_9ZZZZ